MKAIFCAFLAAVFYAINIPASKVLLRDVGPTTMAALLYLGAGIGIAALSLFNVHDLAAVVAGDLRRVAFDVPAPRPQNRTSASRFRSPTH